MTPDTSITKWRASTLKERSASQSHFNDLCELLTVNKPTDVDQKGEWYCFERGAAKTAGGEGWADVWKRGVRQKQKPAIAAKRNNDRIEVADDVRHLRPRILVGGFRAFRAERAPITAETTVGARPRASSRLDATLISKTEDRRQHPIEDHERRIVEPADDVAALASGQGDNLVDHRLRRRNKTVGLSGRDQQAVERRVDNLAGDERHQNAVERQPV
jgi:hypothetical protein